MTAGKVGFMGKPPKAVIAPAKSIISEINDMFTYERKKYIRVWDVSAYRKRSPGENLVDDFLDVANPPQRAHIIDWGCGTGRGGFKLYNMDKEYDITLVDFAYNCLDKPVKRQVRCDGGERLRFIEEDLNNEVSAGATYGFCTDVMEHIPEEEVDNVLDNILNRSKHVYFQICLVGEKYCKHPKINTPLHITIKPYGWWLRKFAERNCLIHASRKSDYFATFYVTKWAPDVGIDWDKAGVNLPPEVVEGHIRKNAKITAQKIAPSDPQDIEVMLLAGGPSLNDFTEEIIENRKAGMPMITINGTYHWAIEKGLEPSMQLIIDARELNKKFLDPIQPKCKYVIASQCHPSLLESVPEDQRYVWHVSLSDELMPILEDAYGQMHKDWFPIPGGSTCTLRAFCLLRMLGFSKIHVYGFDSCLRGDEHHAYEQEENNTKNIIPMVLGEGTDDCKEFMCQSWMVYQAYEFMNMVPQLFKNIHLNIKGDGLIAYIVNTGAQLATLNED